MRIIKDQNILKHMSRYQPKHPRSRHRHCFWWVFFSVHTAWKVHAGGTPRPEKQVFGKIKKDENSL